MSHKQCYEKRRAVDDENIRLRAQVESLTRDAEHQRLEADGYFVKAQAAEQQVAALKDRLAKVEGELTTMIDALEEIADEEGCDRGHKGLAVRALTPAPSAPEPKKECEKAWVCENHPFFSGLIEHGKACSICKHHCPSCAPSSEKPAQRERPI